MWTLSESHWDWAGLQISLRIPLSVQGGILISGGVFDDVADMEHGSSIIPILMECTITLETGVSANIAHNGIAWRLEIGETSSIA